MVRILDLSHYNIVTDWDKIEDPVILKCTESTNYLDPTFKERQLLARAKGIYYGSYHFFRDVNIDKQVEWYLKNAKPEAGEVMVLDFEIECPDAQNKCKQFLQRLKDKTGARLFLYTNEARVLKYDWTTVAKIAELWVAKYSNQ
jgi:GH25 family lysozyme M1 (1,4-beta-N-acetylmuramidase)